MWRKCLPGSHWQYFSLEVYHNKLDWKLPFTGELKIEPEMIESQDLPDSAEVVAGGVSGWVVSGPSVETVVTGEYYWLAGCHLARTPLGSISLLPHGSLPHSASPPQSIWPLRPSAAQAAQPVSAEPPWPQWPQSCSLREEREERGSDSVRACPVHHSLTTSLSVSHSLTCPPPSTLHLTTLIRPLGLCHSSYHLQSAVEINILYFPHFTLTFTRYLSLSLSLRLNCQTKIISFNFPPKCEAAE